MRSLWQKCVVLLFPHKCFLCGKVLAGEAFLCPDCSPPETGGGLCRCGKETCICERVAGIYDGATAPFYYSDGVERGIYRFKYDGRAYYAEFLGGCMAKKVQETFSQAAFDFITFVPLHRRKLRQRGFCQTEALARVVSEALGLPVRDGILLHTGKGRPQMRQKGLQARLENVKKAFTADKTANLQGKTVLLVDDVLTTGATALRCAELLKARGAKEVYVVTAATTKKRHSKTRPCNSASDTI